MTKHQPIKRRSTNVILDEALIADAHALGINVSRECETGLAAAVKKVREDRWREENAESIAAWNDYVEKNGLPLEDLRLF